MEIWNKRVGEVVTVVLVSLGLIGVGSLPPSASAQPARSTVEVARAGVRTGFEGQGMHPSPAALGRFVAGGHHLQQSPAERLKFFLEFARVAPNFLGLLWRRVGREIPLEAMEAAAPEIERVTLDRLSELTEVQQLALMVSQGRGPSNDKKARKRRAVAISGLRKDPALQEHFGKIQDRWLAGLPTGAHGPLYSTVESFIDLKVLIARNLYFGGGEISRSTVRDEVRRLLELRERFGEAPVFRGRQVVFLASAQRAPGSRTLLFAPRQLRTAVARQAAKFWFPLGHSGEPEAPPPIAAVLEEVEASAPLTVLFSGHGRARALRYRGSLKVREFARLLAEQPAREGEPTIVILLACYSYNFARRLLEDFEELDPDLPKPILVTPEEHGQAWEKAVFGGRLDRALDSARPTVTLQRFAREWGVGASVLVPDDDNQPRQIF